jgi:hypothetical protein
MKWMKINLWLQMYDLLSEVARYRCYRTLETPGIASQKSFSITGIWWSQIVQVISKFNSGTSEALQFIKTSTRISSIAYHAKTNSENTSAYLHQLFIPIWLKQHRIPPCVTCIFLHSLLVKEYFSECSTRSSQDPCSIFTSNWTESCGKHSWISPI